MSMQDSEPEPSIDSQSSIASSVNDLQTTIAREKDSLLSRAMQFCQTSADSRSEQAGQRTDITHQAGSEESKLVELTKMSPSIHHDREPAYSSSPQHLKESLIISEDIKNHLIQAASRNIEFSPSVTKQNHKTEQVYLNFVRQMGFQSYPITQMSLATFLIWLAESGRYTAKTLETVTYYSLCRLNILRTGAPIDRSAQQSALALLRKFRSDTEMKKPRGGMEPIIPDDVSRMVDVMDKGLLITPALASLFNFAMATGARGNSCGEVRLCDLGPLYENPDGTSLLVVRIVKLKARPHETLQLSLAGHIDTESTIDVLYWLDQHLHRNFGITLRELVYANQSGSSPRTQKLWPYSTDSMTRYVKTRLEAAGIPAAKFGFHSFRSGFMAACIIQAERKGESIEDVLTRVAIITGWRPLDRVQFQYLRDAVRRRMVTTDMIGTTKTESFMLAASFEPKGEANHANTFQFHNIPERPPQPRRQAYILQIKRSLGKLIYVRSASKVANKRYLDSCFDWCLTQLAIEEAAESHQRGTSLSSIGRQILEERMTDDVGKIVEMARTFFEKLQRHNKLKTTLLEPTHFLKEMKASEHRELTPYAGRERRKPIAWSKEEEDIFLDGIKQELNRYQIADKLPLRTSFDVYYHYRHLNSLRQKKGQPLLHLKPAPLIHGTGARKRDMKSSRRIRHDDSDTVREHTESTVSGAVSSWEKSTMSCPDQTNTDGSSEVIEISSSECWREDESKDSLKKKQRKLRREMKSFLRLAHQWEQTKV